MGPVRLITNASQISLPLDGYQMTVEEDLLIQQAEWHLAVACLARFGVTHQPPEAVPGLSRVNHDRLYGLLDLEAAARWGYAGEDPAKLRAAREAANRAQPQTAKETEELLDAPSNPGAEPIPGVPEDGCMGEARRELAAGREPVDENLVFDMAYAASTRAEADERVRAAVARWSQCMRRAGFVYDNPWEPNNHPWPRQDDTVSEQEKTVAAADVRCKHETNLVGIWNAVDVAYQLRLIEQNKELLAALKQSRTHRVERAATIMSRAGEDDHEG